MNVLTTTPQLTADDKRKLHDWLVKALANDEHCFNTESVDYILPRLVLFEGDAVKTLASNNYWALQDFKIYVGYATRRTTAIKDCLQVLCALTQYADASEQLEQAKAGAVARYLLGEHREFSKAGLIDAPVEPKGLAFSEDQVAALLGGEWMLPNGEVVDVSGDEWKVCATTLPRAAAVADRGMKVTVVLPDALRANYTPNDIDF